MVSVVLLLMCFPVFEANQFGGYTTVLALAFMLLVLLYTPLAVERLGYLVVAFFAAFSLVLGHQLGAFLAAFIMPPDSVVYAHKIEGQKPQSCFSIGFRWRYSVFPLLFPSHVCLP